jgi:hypothetical protein
MLLGSKDRAWGFDFERNAVCQLFGGWGSVSPR